MERSAGRETFATLLRQHRRVAGLTQEALAARAGLSPRGVQHLEAGDARPYRATVQALAEALGLAEADRAQFAAAVPVFGRSGRGPTAAAGLADAHCSPVPAEPNALIGREHDLAATRALLLQPGVRLLTLAGPGGSGKTRLAFRLAEEVRPEFAAGVRVVALASLAEPALVLPTIAQALGLPARQFESPFAALQEHLRGRALLLVLDNFEHLMGAAPDAAALLEHCRTLTLLVTSRTLLRLRSEHVFYVPPLALPPPDGEGNAALVAAAPAVALFLERVHAAGVGLALAADNVGAVSAICRRLDGLPLAIELAAARAPVLPPPAMLARLQATSGGLALLAGGVRDLPTRQQTLRRTIAWSHDLLPAPGQQLYRCLAVFAGGTTPNAVEAIWCQVGDGRLDPLHGLAGLVDACLVQREEHGGETRIRMLETIREDALERLEVSGAAAAVRFVHARYYLTLAERAAPDLIGPEQAICMERLERDHDNLRAALAWSLSPEGSSVHGIRLAVALWWFWHLRGHAGEGKRWLERLLACPGAVPEALRAKALYCAGHLEWDQGDYALAAAHAEESLALAERLDDSVSIAFAAIMLAAVSEHRGVYRRAESLASRALTLFRQAGHGWGLAVASRVLSRSEIYQGHHDQARAHAAEALRESRRLGDRWAIGLSLFVVGLAARHQGNLREAQVLLEQSVATFREIGERQDLARPLQSLGCVVRNLGDAARGESLLREALALSRDIGDRGIIAASFVGLAGLACLSRQFARASRLLGATEALLAATGYTLPPADRADYERYAATLREALAEPAAAAALAEGAATPLAQTIAYALATKEKELERTSAAVLKLDE
jgi:predicted ATPase/DNA-binding XRE family transcriptional regulator